MFEKQTESIHFIKTNFDEYREKETERKIEIKKDLLMEIATKADIVELKGEINELRAEMGGNKKELKGTINELRQELKGNINELRQELKGDIKELRKELKGDIYELRQELKGDIKELRKELKGDISVLDAKFSGEFKSIRLWMKFLVGIAIIGITFFSPTTLELIKILKSF